MTEAATDTKAAAADTKATDAAAPDTKATDAAAPDAKATDAAAPDAKATDAAAADTKATDAAAPEAAPKPLLPSKVDIQTLKVDDEVTSWCGKCKTFRPHTVKTLQPPKPPKSVCLTCRAVHQVRLHEPGTKKKLKDGPLMPELPPWPELVAGVNPDDATKYTIGDNFQIDDFVMHKLFGLGKVVRIDHERRARVSFEAGIKSMIQNTVRPS